MDKLFQFSTTIIAIGPTEFITEKGKYSNSYQVIIIIIDGSHVFFNYKHIIIMLVTFSDVKGSWPSVTVSENALLSLCTVPLKDPVVVTVRVAWCGRAAFHFI